MKPNSSNRGPGAPPKFGRPMVGRTLKLPLAWWRRLAEIAHRESTPGARVSAQDLIRRAISETHRVDT